MRHQRRRAAAGRAPAASSRPVASASAGAMPQRPMPVSALTWTPQATPDAAQPAVVLERGDDDLEPARAAPPRPARAARARRSARRRRAPARSSRASSSVAQQTRAAPGRERRAGALDGAVPVAVGLHDRPELGCRRRPRAGAGRWRGSPRGRPAASSASREQPSERQQQVRRRRSRPRSATARRAAEPCATAASASASAGGEPARAERPDRAGEHVARARRGELRHGRLDHAQRLARRGDERVGALQQHRGARALGRLARRSRAARSPTAALSRPSRRPSSPACGVSAVGPARAAQRLEPAGEREQRVGIEHERRLDAAHERVDERRASRRAPEARARRRRRRREPRARARARRRARRAPSAPGACAATAACSLSGTHTHTTPAPARSAASAASAGAPLMPGEPPTTSTPPASYFEPVGERRGTSARSAALHAQGPRGPGERDRAGRSAAPPPRPQQPRPGSIAVPSVRPWNASVSAASIAAPSTRPLRAVHPARHVERDDRRRRGRWRASTSASAAPSSRPRKPLPKSASTITSASSGARSGTPNAAAAARIVRASAVVLSAAASQADAGAHAGHVQVARHDEPVAAVVAGPAQHADRARRRRSARARAARPRAPAHSISAMPRQSELVDCAAVELAYLFRVPEPSHPSSMLTVGARRADACLDAVSTFPTGACDGRGRRLPCARCS